MNTTSSGRSTGRLLSHVLLISLAATLLLLSACQAQNTGAVSEPSPAGQKLALPQRLVYYSINLSDDKNADAMEAMMRRAAAAKYTGIMFVSGALAKLDAMPPRYFENTRRIQKVAEELKLEIIPSVFPLGYSSSILSHNPNLVEGQPVRDALFVVHHGEATLQSDPGVMFPPMVQWQRDPAWIIDSGGTAILTKPDGAKACVSQTVKVHPFRQYHITFRLKTDNLAGLPTVRVLADGGKRDLNCVNLHEKPTPTQDWTLENVTFNSLDYSEVVVQIGAWDNKGFGYDFDKGALSGKMWVQDPGIFEVGLVNLIRRPGCPVTVKIEDGKELKEGVDFAKLVDPKMGFVDPYFGDYDVYHEPPVIKLLPASGVSDGTHLRVSYCHAATVLNSQCMVCPSEPESIQLLRDNARRVHELWGGHCKAYMMNIDEVRIFNQCAACRARGLDAGPLFADMTRTCIKIIRETDPGAKVYVWSDMYDPFHNAHGDYFLVRGSYAGSWEGLDKDVVIVAWAREFRDQTLPFFVARGNKMIVTGFYDIPSDQVAGDVKGWLDSVRKHAPNNTVGIMHATWEQNFKDIEAFSAAVDKYR